MITIACPGCEHATALYTADDVAERVGLAPVTIRQRAFRRGIGTIVDARTRLYTDADIEALVTPARRGRPHA